MKALHLVFLACLASSPALAHDSSTKIETVEEKPVEQKEKFCAKTNADDAKKLCDTWLNRQLKTLGDKVLTSNCTSGDMTTDTSCLYRADGEVTYVLKKHRTETERH